MCKTCDVRVEVTLVGALQLVAQHCIISDMLPSIPQTCTRAQKAGRSHAPHAQPCACPHISFQCSTSGRSPHSSFAILPLRPRPAPVRIVSRSTRGDFASPQGTASNNQSQQQPDSIEAEIEFQEHEAGLTIEDLMNMHYEVPTDEQLDGEAAELLEEEGLAAAIAAAAARPSPAEAGAVIEDEDEEAEARARFTPEGQVDPAAAGEKAAVLMEILAAAGTGDLDAKLVQFQDQIDEELLALLQLRIDMAAKVGCKTAAYSKMCICVTAFCVPALWMGAASSTR